MPRSTLSARYAAASKECGGGCPIEAGALGRLADNECRHGRLAGDRTPPCGCWPQEPAPAIPAWLLADAIILRGQGYSIPAIAEAILPVAGAPDLPSCVERLERGLAA